MAGKYCPSFKIGAVMDKKYLHLFFAAGLLLVVSVAVLFACGRMLLYEIPVDKAAERIEAVKNGPFLISKELLLDSYKRHIDFEKSLRERDAAYLKLLKVISLFMVLIIAV